jgi:Ca-activated chloride channel family protein
MRQFWIAALIAVALFAPSATAQDATFHAEVHLVTLTFSVHDAAGKPVPALSENDFHVTEDGVPQKIASFSRESQLPLKIGLLVDVSDSQNKFLKQHIKDTEVFLREILRPQDQVFAVCFGDHLRVAADLTSSPEQIVEGLQHFDKNMDSLTELSPDKTRSGGTAIFDAVAASVQERLTSTTGHRRVLILFTDGEENSSAHDEVDAIAAAQGADTLVYAVRYTEIHHGRLSASNRQGAAILHHLTTQTGGIDFDGLHTDLPEAFHQIAEELRSQYSIGYYSTNKTNDGSFRKVVIEPVQPGLTVRARAGYYASLPPK